MLSLASTWQRTGWKGHSAHSTSRSPQRVPRSIRGLWSGAQSVLARRVRRKEQQTVRLLRRDDTPERMLITVVH
ncbi:hypothetical protein TGRH88_027420 [Toxoplasma gondii]|uniref:Uncharacterized protein n=1 Tax=Toxoplasma gondii TaxID=5811 RepID=A0A7J6KBZ6_TOXGO|nr:hypothetical protein TGRH88_027420 [Toxoplasma gondii]